MKILRHNGQKVLEAPIDFDVISLEGKGSTSMLMNLTTIDRGTKYMMTLDIADITNLFHILSAYRHPPDEER